MGAGGAGVVAAAVGVAADTVRRGRMELQDPSAPPVGVSRRPGGGRKRAEVHDPGLVAALESLIDPETRGDPESSLRWTTESCRTLAKALQDDGYRVSEFVVRRLLKEAGYSVQAHAKTTEGRQHPDRDAQFGYLNEQVKDHQSAQHGRTRAQPMSARFDQAGWCHGSGCDLLGPRMIQAVTRGHKPCSTSGSST